MSGACDWGLLGVFESIIFTVLVGVGVYACWRDTSLLNGFMDLDLYLEFAVTKLCLCCLMLLFSAVVLILLVR